MLVAVTQPSLGHMPFLRKIPEPVFVRAFIPAPPVAVLTGSVLHRPAGLDQVMRDSPSVSPMGVFQSLWFLPF
jgi:hypothetical protein